jgi:acetamidase/formamidase
LSEFVEVQGHELENEKEEGSGQGFGSLHVSVCCLKEETTVEVNVIKGESLPSPSKNGESITMAN